MKLQPLSKSKYEVFLKCPWKAHALKNLGLEDAWGLAADNGIEAHDHLAGILSGSRTAEEAFACASSPDVQFFISRGIELNPIIDPNRALFENSISIDKKGKLTSSVKDAIAHGILDMVEPVPEQGILKVSDWKTGKWEKDNTFERSLYGGLLAHALFPDIPTIHFDLIFVRSGNILHSEYHYSDKGRSLLIKSPNGKEEFLSDTKNPLLSWLEAILRKIRSTPAKPNPGSHCLNWYGQPCIFHGAECPLSAKLPATTHEILPDYAEFKRAFFMLKDHADTITDPADVALGYFAASQLESAAKAVRQNAEAWSDRNGPFAIGETLYGWHDQDVNEVDKEFALRAMIDSDVDLDDMAKAVNISKTSLSKLSKRTYPELREVLLNMAVTTTKKRRFGAATPKGEIE